MMSKLSIYAPLNIDTDIYGTHILTIESLDISRSIETLYTINGSQTNIDTGMKEITGSMLAVTSKDLENKFRNLFDRTIDKLRVVFGNQYLVLKDVMITKLSTKSEDILEDGSFVHRLEFTASDVEEHRSIEVKFIDGQIREVWMSDYLLIKEKYKEPADMTLKQFTDRLILEAL